MRSRRNNDRRKAIRPVTNGSEPRMTITDLTSMGEVQRAERQDLEDRLRRLRL